MTAAGPPPAGPARAPTTHLLYLHGFRSSPQSFKAQRLAAWLAGHRPDVHWWCPQLPPSPREAIDMLLQGTAGWPAASSAVMGSSLGGFYASVLAQARGWASVVINPAIHPARDLAPYVGELSAFHDPSRRFLFLGKYLTELSQLTLREISSQQACLAIIAKGDELLDWREMNARYQNADVRLLEGGDHALSDFEDHLTTILGFLKLCD